MRIDEDIVNRVLDNKGSEDEAKQVAEWFSTEEGNDYLSVCFMKAADTITLEQAKEWLADHRIPEERMRTRLENGMRTELRRKRRKRLMLAAVIVPFLCLTGALCFMAERWGLFTPTEYAEVLVPNGDRMQVVLQDGTTVLLNSQTRLIYPTRFGLFKRKVKLEGEAYFSVAKEKGRAFIVELGALNVKVTGTKFNVWAYGNDFVRVTLDEGGVLLCDSDSLNYQLTPGMTAVYDRTSGICRIIQPEDPETISDWKNNRLNFHWETLGNILKSLERQYDVCFITADSSLLNKHFTLSSGKIPIVEVLKDLQTVSHIKFEEVAPKTYRVVARKK